MKKIIVALDNDETIGSWADLSILYYLLITNKITPTVELFDKIATCCGCYRPGLWSLYSILVSLKTAKLIDEIVMFTAATNVYGWVDFLCSLLEYGHAKRSNTTGIKSKIYDRVIHAEHINAWAKTNNVPLLVEPGNKCEGSYYKYCDMLRHSKLDVVIFVDDRCDALVDVDYSFSVHQYKVALNIIDICKIYIPEVKCDRETLNWKKWLSGAPFSDMYCDIVLYEASDFISKTVNKLHAIVPQTSQTSHTSHTSHIPSANSRKESDKTQFNLIYTYIPRMQTYIKSIV